MLQGSVVTHLRCGGIFSDRILTNFLPILIVKWFWKDSKLFASTTSTSRLFHRAGAATENACLASSVRVLGTIRRGVLESLRVRDGTWSFSSKFRYGSEDIRRALNVRVKLRLNKKVCQFFGAPWTLMSLLKINVEKRKIVNCWNEVKA